VDQARLVSFFHPAEGKVKKDLWPDFFAAGFPVTMM
jgi:hypothetical protein